MSHTNPSSHSQLFFLSHWPLVLNQEDVFLKNREASCPVKIQNHQKMKLTKIKAILAASAAGAIFSMASASAAVVDYAYGDLLIGFTAASGQGSNQIVMVSLGSATALRDATSSDFSLTNIGSELSLTFGTNWYERTDLYWGAIGVYNTSPEGDSYLGDPDGTIYASRSRTSIATKSTAWNPSGEQQALSQIGPMQANFASQTASETNSSAAVFNTNNNSWDKYNPPDVNANISFQIFSSTGLGIEQKFGTGAYGSFFGNEVEGALDLYRVLYNTSGAASYEGTIVINSTGDIGFSPVPEPSTYALIAIGLGAVLFFRRRRTQTA